MIEDERYVDYNRRPPDIIGYLLVRLVITGLTLSKAKVLVAPNSGKSIVGRDWLVALCYKITQPIERAECKVNKQSVKSKKSNLRDKSRGATKPRGWTLEREFVRKITKSKFT